MQPKPVFTIGVRLLGLVFLYHALLAAPTAVGLLLNLFGQGPSVAQLFGLLALAWPFALAAWLMRGAPQLIRFAFAADDHGPGARTSQVEPPTAAPVPQG